MMSLRILLTAWPMWIAPFAYGGPSCSTKLGRPFATLLAQLRVQAFGLPARQRVRLALGQVAAHRERGLRQQDGGLVVAIHLRVLSLYGSM
jgi:hypothetical protein